jgi:hypothetical protein
MMKKHIFYALVVGLFVSCNQNSTSPSPTTTPTESHSSTPSPSSSAEKTPKYFYKSCTFYTGKTDFYFTDESGKEVEVSLMNPPEEGYKYPESMLDPNAEGLPGENPAKVGKAYVFIKDAEGIVKELREVE